MLTFWSNNTKTPHPFSIFWRMGPGEDMAEEVYKTHPNLKNPKKAIEEFENENDNEKSDFLNYFSVEFDIPNTQNYDEMCQIATDKYIAERTKYGEALAKSNPPIHWLIRCYELLFEPENYEFYGYDQHRDIVKQNWGKMIELGFPEFPIYDDMDYINY